MHLQNNDQTTLTKAEVEPFIITQRSVSFNNKKWDIIGVSSPGESDFRPLVPLKLRAAIFHIFHDAIHQGSEKAFRLMESFYYWNNMRGDIIQWCKHCPKCQTCKVSRHNRQTLSNFPNNPWRLEIKHMDLVGPLPTSR